MGTDISIPRALRAKVDGFMYNSCLLYLPNRFMPAALTQLETLRRAQNFRARWFCIPDAQAEPIAAYDTFQYQVNIAPGSYLWGMMFNNLTAPNINSDLLISVVDACTGIPLFNDFVNATIASPGAAGAPPTLTSRNLPVLLTQPRLVLEPGLVDVEIANQTNGSRTCQLVLMFAEPCRVFEE